MNKILTVCLMVISTSVAHSQWIESSSGIPSGLFVQSLHSTGNVLYAGTNDGVFVSTNSGDLWIRILGGSGTIQSITSNGPYMFAGSSGSGVLSTSNNGMNWYSSLGLVTVWSLTSGSGTVYAAVEADRVWKTTNAGALWEPVSPGGNVKSVAVNGTHIFAGFQNYSIGGNGGVHYSTNNGVNWSVALSGEEIRVVTALNGFVAAGALDGTSRSGGVYVSNDNGTTWVRTELDSVPVPALKLYGSSLLAGIANHYYPGFQNYAGFWTSYYAGINWIQMNEGLTSLSNRAVACIEVQYPFAFIGISGGLIYRRSIDQVIGVKSLEEEIPATIQLFQNFPNPFNPETTIKFGLSGISETSLSIYCTSGKLIRTLTKEVLNAGVYEVKFDGEGLASGTYFCVLKTDSEIKTIRLLLLK